MLSFCRTCFRQTCDDISTPLRFANFNRHKLIFCVPEMDLRELPDAKLCKDCAATLDTFYQFKINCRKIEHQVYKQHFGVIKQEINLNEGFHCVCRTCLADVTDGCFLFPTEQLFYKRKLMICVPQMDLGIIPDIVLCKDCRMVLDKLNKFKIKCLDVEKNMKEYQKLHGIVDVNDLFAWYNTFIKNEKYNVEDFTIKQEEVDLADEKEITENMYNPNIYRQLFKCFQCEYSTARKSELKRHIYTHSGEKPFKCPQCEYSAAFKSGLKRHMPTHTGEKPFKCSQCRYSAARKDDIKLHIMRTHIREKPFKCSQCGYSAAHKGDLKQHMRTHSGEKPFKCSHCRYSAGHKGNLKQHMRTHTGEKPFECSQCGYSAAHKGDLKQHTRTHTGEKPFECSHCGYSAAHRGNLKQHMRTHTDEKPFKCSQCEYSAAQGNTLKQHMRTHSGEKPFKCSQCKYSAARKGTLKLHIMRTHSDEKSFK